MSDVQWFLLDVIYRLYKMIARPCCECQLPDFLAKWYFDCNCFCTCHDVIKRRAYKPQATIAVWHKWSIVWSHGVTPGFDPTAWSKVGLHYDGRLLISINAFFDSISLRAGEHNWHAPVYYRKPRGLKARAWKLFERVLWFILDAAENRACPEYTMSAEEAAAEDALDRYGAA